MKKHEKQIKSTEETVTIPRAEYENMQAQIQWLMEQLRLSRQKRFGMTSEHTSEDVMEQLSLLFNEAEVYADQGAQEDDSRVVVASHKRHKKHEYTLDELPEDVPVEVVEHRLPEEELICPECGETMTEIGKDVRRRLKLEPAKVVVVEDWYYTYACRKCEKENIETPVVKAAREPNFIPGSFATPEAAAYLMVQKFTMGSPLYRQEQELRHRGIPLSRQTMSNWLLWGAEHLLKPVYNLLHQELLKREVLHADETTLQVLHEPGKTAQSKSYMWLYRTGSDDKHLIVLYDYQPSRSGDHAVEFLKGFHGYLHTDGYSGYNKPGNITRCGCWAHLRWKNRLFSDTPKGVSASASVYSIIETAKANSLNVYTYLEYLLLYMPDTDWQNHPEDLDDLMPWSETVQAEM